MMRFELLDVTSGGEGGSCAGNAFVPNVKQRPREELFSTPLASKEFKYALCPATRLDQVGVCALQRITTEAERTWQACVTTLLCHFTLCKWPHTATTWRGEFSPTMRLTLLLPGMRDRRGITDIRRPQRITVSSLPQCCGHWLTRTHHWSAP